MNDLLAAILADPTNDAPRLVYADWLSERDDPRGEFIQIQCTLGGAMGASGHVFTYGKDARSVTAEELQAREKKLLTKHQKEWIAPIRAPIRTWTWKRGFVNSLVADGAKFLAEAETIVANTPLEELTLTALKAPQHDTLSRSPALAKIRFLHLHEQKIGPKSAHLFLSPHLSEVEHLDIWGNPLGDAGGLTLARAQHLGKVRKLHLSRCGLGDAAIEAIAAAPFFAHVTDLELSSNPLTAAGVAAIARHGVSLRKLGLNKIGSAPPLGNEAAFALASAPALKNLEHLMLDWSIGPEGTEALLASPHLASVKHLGGVVSTLDIAQTRPESPAGIAFRQRFPG